MKFEEGKRSLSLPMSQVTHQAGAYPGFCSMRATRSNSTPSWLRCLSFAGLPPALNSLVPIYTPGCMERGTVRAKCLAQEHNRMPQAKARTRSVRYGVEHTNHETTTPPKKFEEGIISTGSC